MPKKAKDVITCQYYHWNLFRRDGVFYADGRLNEPTLGKHSLGTRDRDEAMTALRELGHRKAVEHQNVPPRSRECYQDISIEDGWRGYLSHIARPDVLGGAGTGTQKRYRAVRDKHIAFCQSHGIRSWSQVDKKHLHAYGSHLTEKGYADGTVYLELTLLKQIIKWMIDEEKSLPNSHRIQMYLRRSEDSSTYCYSRDQIAAMIHLCQSNSRLQWLADAIVALASTGMRAGEIAALRWSDVDLATGIITLPDNRHSGRHQIAGAIRTTKGRRTRRVPIHSRLHSVLETMSHRHDGRVFSGPSGSRFLPNSVCKIFIRDVIGSLKEQFSTPDGEIGFASGRLHSFRHAFVSQAFIDGASEGEIREWVGHTNSRIVERYRHLGDEDARRKMDKIDFFGSAQKPALTTEVPLK